MVTQNAKAIQEAGDALYAKLVNVHEYIEKVGASLSAAMAHHIRFVGAIEGHGGAFSLTRKLGSLVNSGDEIETLELFAAEPGALAADNWTASWALALTGKDEPADPVTT